MTRLGRAQAATTHPKTRTVGGLVFHRVMDGAWRTEDGYRAELHEGGSSEWAVHTPNGVTFLALSLRSAAAMIVAHRKEGKACA